MNKSLFSPCFFCVPDITGFTRLITSADIEFSSLVIPALLNRLMDCNNLAMSVAEIEGDAIFFYRTGEAPSPVSVMEQCDSFYQCFADTLNGFKQTDPENYQKYLANSQVGLKVIVHYGNVMPALIKGRVKLIGTDVITIHRLLKNSISATEYILLTESYLNTNNEQPLTSSLNESILSTGSDSYEYLGRINYKFVSAPRS
ncbi:DUF2652 domain-containing protein [Pedobacter sp. HMF7647]|uniref:DUF2652 domain-containing protein n=1 Tax=Hufsiella arboris TaxID=2695275 RepID=A0A7K1YF13_9SPHI|nr:DUF2652 domain-containing protein [Hufsiella arboris]MXV53194.1 DUF2652 domain-containing protein [Hufsiella arboris]